MKKTHGWDTSGTPNQGGMAYPCLEHWCPEGSLLLSAGPTSAPLGLEPYAGKHCVDVTGRAVCIQ